MGSIITNQLPATGENIQQVVGKAHSIREQVLERHSLAVELFKRIQEARSDQFRWWEQNGGKLKKALSPSDAPKTEHAILYLSTQEAIKKLRVKHAATQIWFTRMVDSPPSLPVPLTMRKITDGQGQPYLRELNCIEAATKDVFVYLTTLREMGNDISAALDMLQEQYISDSSLLYICERAQECFGKYKEAERMGRLYQTNP